jgi:protein-S-isoprenylcysteine O-methyltransferase Ste14
MTLFAAKIAWLVGVVAWYVIRYPYARRAKRIGIRRRRDRPGELALLFVAALGLFVVPLIYVLTGQPALADYQFTSVQGIIGVLVFIGALWLFQRSHQDLGRNWSIGLDIREQQSVVSTGVYSRIRHPMYAAFWLQAVAQALLLPNWIAGPAGLVAVALLFFARVGREERLMLEEFGDDYRRYMARTSRIVPGLY